MLTRTIRGVEVPAFFYGTAWKEERTAPLTTLALAAGFRAIDTANQRKHYFEAGVGEAIAAAYAAGAVRREDLFLQTKFTHAAGQDERKPYADDASPGDQVRQSFASSLEHLGTTWVDSLVLHGPMRRDGMTDRDFEVWAAMEEIAMAGGARLLGVSNVGPLHLKALVARARVKPAFVQNRCFARTGWDKPVRVFCHQNDMVYQAFSMLTANRDALDTPAVQALVQRTGRSPAELVFRWAAYANLIPLTGTSSEEHMRTDLAALDFELSGDDQRIIGTCGVAPAA